MKNKFISGILIVFVTLSIIMTQIFTFAVESDIKVSLNGNNLIFDQAPLLLNGRVLVPLRVIFEAMGAQVEWKAQTRQVIAKTIDTTVSLTLDSTVAYVNNKQVSLDVPGRIFNGRTLVPVRFVSESLGGEVNWSPQTRTVQISSLMGELANIPGIASILDKNNPTRQLAVSPYDSEFIYGDYELFLKIPGNTIKSGTALTIVPCKVAALNENIIAPIACYDVKLSGLSTFKNPLTIEMPYTENILDKSLPEEAQLIAGYFDEKIGLWKEVPFEVDADANFVKITTDHLTPFMLGVVKDKESISKINTLGKTLAGVFQGVFDKAKGTASTIAETVKDSFNTSVNEMKVYYLTLKAVKNALWPSQEVISVYSTENFRIVFSTKEEEEMTSKGYIYAKPQFKETDYPVVAYDKNFVEVKNDLPLKIDESLARYPKKTSFSQVVPARIKELGIFLEEANKNYKKDFKEISTPYTVYVAKGGSPRDNKFTNTMYIPIEYLSDPAESKTTCAHELFHAFQRKYANVVDLTRNNWLMEATAEYASYKVAYTPPIAFNGFRKINMNYFQRPIGTTEPLIIWTRGEHEYKSAKFIEYLFKNYGATLKEFFEYYSQRYTVNDFIVLDDFFRGKKPDFMLGKAYLDFVGYMMFDSAGDLSIVDMLKESSLKYTFKDKKLTHDVSIFNDRTYIPLVASVKVELPAKVKKMLLLKSEAKELGLGTNIYLLKGNTKASGIKPILEVYKDLKNSQVVEVENGDVIYIISSNAAPQDPLSTSHTIKGTITIEETNLEMKVQNISQNRTTRNIKCTLEGSMINPVSTNLEYKWTVISKKGDVLNLNDPKVAKIEGANLTVTLTHKNPINSWEEKIKGGWVAPNSTSTASNPFGDIIIANIDDGTEYIITAKVIDKISKKELGSVSKSEIVGMLSSMKSVSGDSTGVSDGTVVLP